MRKKQPRRVPLDLRGLTGRDGIFRLDGGSKRDPEIEAWMCEGQDELRSIARKWFERIRECGEDVCECMHDGQPTACVGDAAFAYVAAFRDHVNVGFFRGAELADAAGLLEGTGKSMRHVKVWPGRSVDDAALQDLIHAAHADMQRRLRAR
jgi:hypothetical protein